MQETWVWSLDQEDPLEVNIAIHSSIHAWRIPWTGEPGRLQSIGLQRVRYWVNYSVYTLINIWMDKEGDLFIYQSSIKEYYLAGRLESMGLQRVRHNWATKHSTFSYKKKEILLLDNGINLEDIILKWTKPDIDKYCMISLTCGILKVNTQKSEQWMEVSRSRGLCEMGRVWPLGTNSHL